MKQKQIRPGTSMGMFDLFKGIAIISVIVFHTLMFFLGFEEPISSTIGNVLLNGFVIVAGYGVRKKSNKKCLRQIKNAYLIPYLFTVFLTPLFFLVVHIALFRFPPSSFIEAQDIFLGLIFGQYPTYEYFGHRVYSCGPVWFVVAISGSLFLLNLIQNCTNGKWTVVFVIICTIIGSTISKTMVLPYCLTHIFAFVPGLYIGFLAREKKLYTKKVNISFLVIMIVALLCLCIGIKDTGISLSAQEFLAGPLSLIALDIVSFGCVFLCTRINRVYSKVINILEWLGHNSYYILCLHTIEYTAGNWYYFIENIRCSKITCFFLIFFSRSLFIALGLAVILLLQEYKRRVIPE